MGRFIREQSAREGVAVDGIITDKERLTALVLLAVEEEGVSPMIFYRSDCADMALCEDDIDEAFIKSSRSVLVSGTHFSQAQHRSRAAQGDPHLPRKTAARSIFDIDYRPNLWGLAGHDAGFERYVASDHVSNKLKTVLADCDLVVGTEEEVLIASGESDLLAALKTIRSLSKAVIVLKRGAKGCIVYDGAISDNLEDGIVGDGFPIEIYNVLGAGDAFMSGPAARLSAAASRTRCQRHLGQRLRRVRRVAAAVLAGICDVGGVAVLPQERLEAARAAQRRGPQPCPLVHNAQGPAHPADDGAGLRPPLAA